MLSFKAAQKLFADSVRQVAETERVWLGVATGRVLAQDVTACVDAPSADKSAMDGYAIRSEDLASGRPFVIQQVCYAGMTPRALRPGHATRLFTGSLLPRCADTVIPEEEAIVSGEHVHFATALRSGAHIRRRGEDVCAGSPLVSAGTVLSSGHIAALASQGIEEVRVFRLVEVALLVTGDEVAGHGEPVGPHQVRDVNGPMLESLVESLGSIVRSRRYVGDDEHAIHEALVDLTDEADIVLVTGGAAGGAKDLGVPALVSAGGELLFHRVNMKPGKPVSAGRLSDKAVVFLPGNPGAVYTTFALLVSPMLRKLQGRVDLFPPVTQVRADIASKGKSYRDEFLRATRAAPVAGLDCVRLHEQQSSGSVSLLGDASGFVHVAPQTILRPNDLVPYYDFATWLR